MHDPSCPQEMSADRTPSSLTHDIVLLHFMAPPGAPRTPAWRDFHCYVLLVAFGAPLQYYCLQYDDTCFLAIGFLFSRLRLLPARSGLTFEYWAPRPAPSERTCFFKTCSFVSVYLEMVLTRDWPHSALTHSKGVQSGCATNHSWCYSLAATLADTSESIVHFWSQSFSQGIVS